MGTATIVNLTELASQWRAARRIYPIYAALAGSFDLGTGPCRELESPINRSEPDVMLRIKKWLELVDDKIQVWQLRQLLQTSHLATEENLRLLILRHLKKAKKNESVRDKLDYLLVQYYAQAAPHDSHNAKIDFAHVAEVLLPAVGEVAPELPPFCNGVIGIIKELDECKSLGDLLDRKIIEKARELKIASGDQYFEPSVLVEFTRFNFLMRMGFFRLMHADLHAIRFALHEMEGRGQTVCDCSSVGLSSHESLTNLREICHNWKQPFRAKYSAGNNFKQMVAIRVAVEAAVKAPVLAPELVSATPAAETVTQAPVENAPAVAKTAGIAAEVKPEAKSAAAGNGAIPDLDSCLDQIAEQLLNVKTKSASVSNVVMGGTKLLLASWEAAAFIKGGDEMSDALQRAVAARAILNLAFERKKKGAEVDLGAAIGLAHAEAGQIQERIAEAKDAKNIDAAVNLAATAKRLLGQIAEAEKIQ